MPFVGEPGRKPCVNTVAELYNRMEVVEARYYSVVLPLYEA